MKKVKEYKHNAKGKSFFIHEDDFTKDVKPVNEDETFENRITEDEKAQAWSEFEYEMWLMNYENNF